MLNMNDALKDVPRLDLSNVATEALDTLTPFYGVVVLTNKAAILAERQEGGLKKHVEDLAHQTIGDIRKGLKTVAGTIGLLAYGEDRPYLPCSDSDAVEIRFAGYGTPKEG